MTSTEKRPYKNNLFSVHFTHQVLTRCIFFFFFNSNDNPEEKCCEQKQKLEF